MSLKYYVSGGQSVLTYICILQAITLVSFLWEVTLYFQSLSSKDKNKHWYSPFFKEKEITIATLFIHGCRFYFS